LGEKAIPNDVRIAISGENLSQAAISGVNTSFAQMQQSAGATNATLAQTATALAGVEAQGAKLTNTLREAGSTQQVIRTLQELAASGQAAAGQVAPLIAQLQRLEGEGSKASLSIRQVDGEIKAMSVSVRQASTATTPWVQAVNQLSSVIPGLSQAMQTYSASSAAAGASSATAAQGAAGLAAGLSPLVIGAAGAAAAVGGIALAVHSAVEAFAPYQTSLLKVQGLTGATAAETAAYDEKIRDLARNGPISAKAIADGLYYITSSGFKSAEALDVLSATQKAAAAGFGTFTNVADAVTSALKAYHLSADQAGRITDIFAASVIEGKVEANTFAQSIGLVLPIAANLGVNFEQVGAAIATMTNQGLHADEAVTALKNILSEMLHPTEQGTKALESMGITTQQLRDILADPSQGLPAMLKLLSERTGTNIELLGKIIPDIRGLNGVLALGGVAAGEFNAILDKTTGSFGRVDDANKIASQGFENRMSTLRNKADDLKLAIGGTLVTALFSFTDHLQNQVPKASQTAVTELEKIANAANDTAIRLEYIANQRNRLPQPDKPLTPDEAEAFIRSRTGLGAVLGGMSPLNESQIAAIRQAAAGAATAQPVPGAGGSTETFEQYMARRRTELGLTMPGQQPPPAPPPPLMNPDQLRASAQVYTQVNNEADKLHNTLVEIGKLPAGSNTEVINKRLGEVYRQSEELAQQWLKTFDPAQPERAAQRVDHLRGLVDAYTQTVISGSKAEQQAAAAAIDSYTHEVAAESQRAADAKKTADYEKQRANDAERDRRERERQAREAQQADVGTGLREAMAKGFVGADLKRDLNPAAAKVMDDFMAAMEAQGTQSAAGTGKTLGTAIIGVAEEMRKSGAGDWQETMARMFDVADAIRRGEPGAVQAFHDLALHASQTIDQAKIAEAWGKQLDAAERQIRQGDQRHTNAMTDAGVKRADAMADAQRQEGERVAEARARQHIDAEMREEQHGLELQRIKERWGREDLDRAEQQARARQDHAERNGRALAEATLRQQESETNAQRQMLRTRQESQIEHQERVSEILRKGGPGMGQALADENRSFQEQQIRQQRQESYATQDRQAQQQQQMAEAMRRQTEGTAELARRQREAESDLVKGRVRQLTDRTQQMGDQDTLAASRLEKERAFHIDAESKAQQRYTNSIEQINRRYQHEAQTADRTYEQMKRSLVEKLGAGYAELQSRYPWLTDLGAGVAIPASLTPKVTVPTGFFPLGPLGQSPQPEAEIAPIEHHAEGGQFVVSGSPGEGDNRLVQFYATPGERVGITPAGNVGGGLNPVAPPSSQYYPGTALGATGSFGTAAQRLYPGTDWSTPPPSNMPWGRVSPDGSERFGAPPQASGPTINMDGMFNGAVFVGGSPSDAQKLMEIVSQSIIAKARTILPAGRSPA
jgi:TP901 family phage tail tape measure protein